MPNDLKTIQFDPSLMLGGRNSRKKSKTTKAEANKTAKNNNTDASSMKTNYRMLKELRREQMERNKGVLLDKKDVANHVGPAGAAAAFGNSFDKSLDYFNKKAAGNASVRQYKPVAAAGGQASQYAPTAPTTAKSLPQPLYSCLKGSNTPCYRAWKLQQQNQPHHNTPHPNTPHFPPTHNSVTFSQDGRKMGSANVIHQTLNTLKEEEERQKQMYGKEGHNIQRRHVRTYRVGKSKVKPNVSVLLSNKAIRRNVTEKKYELKKEPLNKIKQKLIRDGFIREGTTAPENILREIYENLSMIGQVKNYNPDIIMYNMMKNVVM